MIAQQPKERERMKKLNRSAAPAARLAAAVLCALMLCAALWCAPTAYAQTEGVISPTEVPVEPVPEGSPADFVRVAAVPANVDIPDFYQQVVNVSGMYIFTMPDGTIHKRIYGALNDVYGWYEPVGQDNIVYEGSQPIDTTQDAIMYYAALSEAERESMARQDFFGLFAPEEGVTQVEQVQGIPMSELTFYCVAGVVGLCFIITVAALFSRSRSRSGR